MSRKPMRVAIRADASGAMGLGHVMRCLALARALLLVGAEVRLLSRDLGFELLPLARAAGVEYLTLPPPDNGNGWEADAADTVAAIAAWQPQWVVVDHYALDGKWHAAASSALRARIAVIDDIADRNLRCDVLIDPNPARNHRDKYAERVSPAIKFLCGPRYALLGPAYMHARALQFHPKVRSIGIFMGGADSLNLSSVALGACREQVRFDGEIEVVTTSANPHRDALRALASRWPRTTVTQDLADLAAFFARHDIQIGAGGSATWERCRVGAPSLLLLTAENQRAVVREMAALGAAEVVGTSSAVEVEIAQAITRLMNDPSRRQHLSDVSRTLVDGRGAARVALFMCGAQLRVRPATVNDADNMYAWRNHPVTREMSRNKAEIERADHAGWLGRTLASDSVRLLVGYVGAIDVGVIRFDFSGSEHAEVSLYLDPALHGLSLGGFLLAAGEEWISTAGGANLEITATVLAENAASRRMFESSGYGFLGDKGRKRVGAAS
jgi:UDP-2,4-diacetamido-2,4,6-trideoxy-beta-L-altropyranose hydrolase